MYTIKQAAARAGLTVPVLRAWERRYGIVSPARTPSGYRLYDDAAIARVSAMRRLVDDRDGPERGGRRDRIGPVGPSRVGAGPDRRRRRRDLLARGTVRRGGRGDGRVRGRGGPRRDLRDRFVRARGRPLPVARPRGARRRLGGRPRRRRRRARGEPRRPATAVGRLPGRRVDRPSARGRSSSDCRRVPATSSAGSRSPPPRDEPACRSSTSVPTCRSVTGSAPRHARGRGPLSSVS